LTGVHLYLLVVVAAVCSALLVPAARRIALRWGAVDLPDARRINTVPVPRLGGIAIFASFAFAVTLALMLNDRLETVLEANQLGWLGFATGCLFIFATGVVDDIWGLRPGLKLAAEFAAATVVVACGGCTIEVVSSPLGPIQLGALAQPAAILWILAVTNAVNLLDGLDGLAAGVVIIALGTIVAIVGGAHATVTILAVILIGAAIGFLAHNFHPASIFMGDSGSLFLGFALAVLSTYAHAKATTCAITLVPLLIVALPLADIVWAMGRRYVRGLVPRRMRSYVGALARMFVPDRQHIHHRLLSAGLNQREALYVLYGVQAVACVAALCVVMAQTKVAGAHVP
jgi:UDP-GlcNAc:undecaprenyl-phosphate GlcNAc-1-phosphate transferase